MKSYFIMHERLGKNLIYLITLMAVVGFSAKNVQSITLPISATPLGSGQSYVIFLDARQLPPPYDIGRVELTIRCSTPNGNHMVGSEKFHNDYLRRGQLYKKRFTLPMSCPNWVRLDNAKIFLVSGRSESGSVQANVKKMKGSIAGTPVNLSLPLSAPGYLQPANGISLSYLPRMLTLSWNPVAGADSYTIEIEVFSNGTWVQSGNYPDIKSPYLEFEFHTKEHLRWRVWAVDFDGIPGVASLWSGFRFTR